MTPNWFQRPLQQDGQSIQVSPGDVCLVFKKEGDILFYANRENLSLDTSLNAQLASQIMMKFSQDPQFAEILLEESNNLRKTRN